jgi:hypothetical protein
LPGDGAVDAEFTWKKSLVFFFGGAGHPAGARTPWSRAMTIAHGHALATLLRGC